MWRRSNLQLTVEVSQSSPGMAARRQRSSAPWWRLRDESVIRVGIEGQAESLRRGGNTGMEWHPCAERSSKQRKQKTRVLAGTWERQGLAARPQLSCEGGTSRKALCAFEWPRGQARFRSAKTV